MGWLMCFSRFLFIFMSMNMNPWQKTMGLTALFLVGMCSLIPGQADVDADSLRWAGCRLVWPKDLEAADNNTVEPDLEVPEMMPDRPDPGERVRQTTAGFPESGVYHTLYLPRDWEPGLKFPVIVEFPGNRFGTCTGRVEDAKLGYGISGGVGFIWICMPFLDGEGKANRDTWWGDEGKYQTGPTIDYCIRTVEDVCSRWGGDPEALVLAGFSRGSIACNYIGLHDDSIARLWKAFICYSHYDGLYIGWPYPDSDREAAAERLNRLQGRPQFICQEILSPSKNELSLKSIQQYIQSTGIKAPVTYCLTGFRNHDDAWILRPSQARSALRKWLDNQL
jgi:hypothetical protein